MLPNDSLTAPRIALGLLTLPLLSTLHSGEYFWTDTLEVGEKALIAQSWQELGDALLHGIPGHYYRPTVVLLHSLDFWLFGDVPIAYRATNLLLHVLNVLLMYGLLHRVTGDAWRAVATASLFAIHPVVLTPLAWISDRTDLLALLTGLLWAICLQNYLRAPRRRTAALAALVMICGLGAKENVAALLFVTATALAVCRRDQSRYVLHFLLLQAAIIVAWACWSFGLDTNHAWRGPTDMSIAERIVLAAINHAEYFANVIVPIDLRVCSAQNLPKYLWPWVLASVAVPAAGVVLLASLWRRRARSSVLAVAWAAAYLAPTSGIVPLNHVRGDRYLYCALPAILFLLVKAVYTALSAARDAARTRLVSIALFMGAYAACCGGLFARRPVFASEYALWRYEIAAHAWCLEGHAYLARYHLANHRARAAERHIAAALATVPRGVATFVDVDTARYYRALIRLELGRVNDAKLDLDALRLSDEARLRAQASYSLALIAFDAEDFVGADEHLLRAQQAGLAGDDLSDTLLLLSYANMKLGREALSRRYARAYASVAPSELSPGRRELLRQITVALRAPSAESSPAR